jgi:hypothetical protein
MTSLPGSDADAGDQFAYLNDRYPPPTKEVAAQWDAIKASEQRRWAYLLPGGGQRMTASSKVGSPQGQSWINVGPSDAIYEWNGNTVLSFDSGRPNTILVDPRTPDIVYVATSGGGVWKSFDFESSGGYPHWVPASDGVVDLAVGALALDPRLPDTLYLGAGDMFDPSAGGFIVKSTNGGGTWSAPVVLTASYTAGTVTDTYRATNVRDLKVDPTNSSNVLVTTNVGLFRSTDGGASFSTVTLPGAKVLAIAGWSVTYVGGSNWLVSGVTACDVHQGPFGPGGEQLPSTTCPSGALGDIWRSTDSGATWTSARAGGLLPAPPTGDDFGRITLAAGSPATPASTVVYAYVGSATGGQSTVAFWRSKDGGATWANATGTLLNPTLGSDCVSMDLGHGQSWYNQAIAVDPNNSDHVIAGGNSCSIRTLNGTAASPVWENASHWLPVSGGGAVLGGNLPYAHADWHTISFSTANGVTRTFSGNDGGVYSSTNVFTAKLGTQVSWANHNHGLVTHLMYSVASGDPSMGNQNIAIDGLQDNGTLMRASLSEPTRFVGVGGGDGVGAAINKGSIAEIWWLSTPGGVNFCDATVNGCTYAYDQAWWPDAPIIPSTDSFPFYTQIAPIRTDPTGIGFLTLSSNQVWQTTLAAGADPSLCVLSQTATVNTINCNIKWKAISPDYSTLIPGFPPAASRLASVTAAGRSPASPQAGVYGVAINLSKAPFSVTSDGGTTWVTAAPVTSPLVGGTARVIGASSIDFPPAPSPGNKPGFEFTVAYLGPTLNDGTPIPDAIGHVFRTTDQGKTWTPISGSGGPSPLPNLPVTIIRYDPVVPKTLYAGTDIGVYTTTDDGATWQRMGNGMPMVKVTDMYIADNQEFVRASTYGRGLWEINPSPTAPVGLSGDGDFDRNLQIDWVDVAALASRLGTTPATDTAPLYNWIVDLTSSGATPTASIDDSDLTTELAKFGSTP